MGVWESVSAQIAAVQARGVKLYGASVREFPGPLPAAALFLYGQRESGWVRWTKTPPQGAAKDWREVSFVQLVSAANGRGEVERADIDPFDSRAAVWGAQSAFETARTQAVVSCEAYGFGEFDDLDIRDRVGLMMAIRACGASCIRGLLRRVRNPPCGLGPLAAMVRWLERDGNDSGAFCGVQSHASVKLRVSWAACAAYRADEVGLGPLPDEPAPMAPRPSGLARTPEAFYARIDTLAARAKAEGDRPTGGWPAGACE